MAEAPTSGLLCTPPNFQVHFSQLISTEMVIWSVLLKRADGPKKGSELTTKAQHSLYTPPKNFHAKLPG